MDMLSLNIEFDRRIKHDLKTYVLLSSNGYVHVEETTLNGIYEMEGYKCHKTVKHGVFTSHIIVRFEEEHFAEAAIKNLESWVRIWFSMIVLKINVTEIDINFVTIKRNRLFYS